MPTSNPTDILLAHDKWASQNILDACSNITDEQFHRKFEMGPGSLHDTIIHMLSAMRGWTDLLAGREFRPRLEPTPRLIAGIQSLLHETYTDFISSAKAHPHDRLVTREREGKSYTFTRGAVITHVTTHGMHHRAQCLNMLRHVGAPQPPSSVLQWITMADAGN